VRPHGWSGRGDALLPGVLGLSDGILTALTLAAGRLIDGGGHVDVSLAARVGVGAWASGAFAFFVARYAELRHQLVRAERQLNLTSHGQLASSHLGAWTLRSSLLAAAVSSGASFLGALVPLLVAAAFPQYRAAGLVTSYFILAALGFGLAHVLHGSKSRWIAAIVFAGVVLSVVGLYLKLV
jgi:VIT1/CCC1 family predicted Fe2+/Mn2+ transporter